MVNESRGFDAAKKGGISVQHTQGRVPDQGLFILPDGTEFMVTINAFFDESGKFKDHTVVTFGGIASPAAEINPFAEDWGRYLYMNGLKYLTMKEALNANRPLSEKNPALGFDARAEALLPFIGCVRKHLQVIVGTALDVDAFTKLPSHYHQFLGNDPFFTAFLRTLIEVLGLTHPDDKLTVICDDDEQMAPPMYKLYRRVKLVDSDARNKLKGLCFADDEYLFALQAADMISSLIRREADKRFFNTPYDYERLFIALTAQPRPSEEKIWGCNISFADKQTLEQLAEDLKNAKKPNETKR